MAYQSKKHRKFLATSLTAAMVASAVAPTAGFAAEATKDFSDVPANHWAKKSIDYLVGKGALEGRPDGTFDLNAEITRGEAAKILSITLGLTIDKNAKASFADAKDHWASSFIAALQSQKAGVINGYDKDTFKPDAKITRQEMAKMVVTAYGLKLDESADISFNDNTGWGKAEVEILASLGVVEGKGAGKFAPEAKVTRAETPVFVHRAEVPAERKEVPYKNATVLSVSAINAKELKITFSRPVQKDTVVAAASAGAEVKDTLVNGAITITSLDSKAVTADAAKATLSEDGKTLILKAQTTEVFDGRYDVQIAAGAIKTTDKKDFPKFETTIKAEDKVAPTIASVEKVTASKYKIKFSEPVKSLGTDTYKLADGKVLPTADAAATPGVRVDFTPGDDFATFTLGSDIGVNKVVEASFVGLQDYALNLISPNPATATFTKGDKDGVAPTVTSLTAINNKTVEVKFSEELSADPTITGVSGTLTYTQDKTDKTKYTIKTDTTQTGLKSVTVSAGFTDLSGETGEAFTKVLNFDIDTVAPKLVSSKVEKGSDNKEYLVLTFDEEVTKAASLASIDVTGTATKDYVTTSTLPKANILAATLVVDTDDKKIARIKLDDLVGSTSNSGTVYELTLAGKTGGAVANAIVDDISGNTGAQSIKVSFTRGTDGDATNSNKATIDKDENADATVTAGENGIVVVDNDTITVMFASELDGVTATNVANYKIDGAVVEKAILNPVASGKQTVTLKLKANSNLFSGERNITISGVKAKNGLAMDTYSTTESLNENVAPTITKAVLTKPNEVTLTFSEAVTNALADQNDFELYIGGSKVSSNDVITTSQQTTAATTLVLTLEANVSAEDIAKGLSIKALDTIDVKDAVSNKASVTGTIVISQ